MESGRNKEKKGFNKTTFWIGIICFAISISIIFLIAKLRKDVAAKDVQTVKIVQDTQKVSVKNIKSNPPIYTALDTNTIKKDNIKSDKFSIVNKRKQKTSLNTKVVPTITKEKTFFIQSKYRYRDTYLKQPNGGYSISNLPNESNSHYGRKYDMGASTSLKTSLNDYFSQSYYPNSDLPSISPRVSPITNYWYPPKIGGAIFWTNCIDCNWLVELNGNQYQIKRAHSFAPTKLGQYPIRLVTDVGTISIVITNKKGDKYRKYVNIVDGVTIECKITNERKYSFN